jgi:hypothetical protein
LIEHALDQREIVARTLQVFAQRLLDDLPGVHHAHRDVLDVFLVGGFDLLVRHRAPQRRLGRTMVAVENSSFFANAEAIGELINRSSS